MGPNLSAEQFCAAPVSMFENGNEMVCVRHTDGEAVGINLSAATTLMQVSEMKPLGEHVAILCERDIGQFLERVGRKLHITSANAARFSQKLQEWRSQGSISTYGSLSKKRIRELSELRAKGLLLSDWEILAKLESGQTAQDPDVTIGFMCIPTANRPERLARCLKSFQENFEKNGRYDTAIFVIEDWEDPSNKQVVERARANSHIRVEHFGLRHRKALIDSLIKRTSVPPETVRFALSPDTSMPARNAFTLMTLGSYIFQTDDDTTCAYTAANSSPDTICLSATNEPCEGWFYPDHETILRERSLDRDFDILAAHEQFLGKSVASAVRRAAKVNWKHVSPELLMDIQRGTGQVEMTATGCLGDSGLYAGGGHVVAASDSTLARMCESPANYDTAVHSGKILRVAQTPVLSRGEYFQGMSYAVDNTRLHPPYFPMGRNGDGVTGLLALLSDTQSWICHLPWAIYHQSDAGRKPYFVEHTEQFSRPRLCDVVMYALRYAAPRHPTMRDRGLVYMGEHLVALGDLPADAFRSFVRGEFVGIQTRMIKSLQERIAAFGPKYPLWEKDASMILANLRRSLTEESSIIPVDLEVDVGAASALEVAQKAIRSYGLLLCSWEELVSESRNIIQQAA